MGKGQKEIMQFAYPPVFQSPAEREIFPLLYTYALKNNLVMEYQKEVGTSDLCESWMEFHTPKYRIDFTFEWYKIRQISGKELCKLAIEIDGKEFHTNIFHEEKRDDYLKWERFKVLHIPAVNVFTKKGKIKIIDQLNQMTGFEYFY